MLNKVIKFVGFTLPEVHKEKPPVFRAIAEADRHGISSSVRGVQCCISRSRDLYLNVSLAVAALRLDIFR